MLSPQMQRDANICSRLTYAGVQVMSFGIKCLCAAAIKRKRKQRSAKVGPFRDQELDGHPSQPRWRLRSAYRGARGRAGHALRDQSGRHAADVLPARASESTRGSPSRCDTERRQAARRPVRPESGQVDGRSADYRARLCLLVAASDRSGDRRPVCLRSVLRAQRP